MSGTKSIPHKQIVVDLQEESSEVRNQIQAVNTLH